MSKQHRIRPGRSLKAASHKSRATIALQQQLEQAARERAFAEPEYDDIAAIADQPVKKPGRPAGGHR